MINNNVDALKRNTKIKVLALIDLAKDKGLDVYVFEGLRSQERQFELYGKGRGIIALKKAKVPTKYANPTAKKVTWTTQSKHIVGEAADIVFDLNKDPKVKKPSWNGDYRTLIEIANYLGLRNLSPLEVCHFEDDNTSIEDVIKFNGEKRHKTINQYEQLFLNKVNNTIRKYL